MSALGHKRTSRYVRAMSALPPKADIGTHSRDVRFVPKADIGRLAPSRKSLSGRMVELAQKSIGDIGLAQSRATRPIPYWSPTRLIFPSVKSISIISSDEPIKLTD